MTILHFLFVFNCIYNVLAVCFFPTDYQGIFAIQTSPSRAKFHHYIEVTILPEAIPLWGKCQSRVGNMVILHDSTGGKNCFRCFHMYLRSPNVIQIYTEELDLCHRNQIMAMRSCPSLKDLRSLRGKELMLYKSRSFNQDGRIGRQMCPFVGRFHFSYGAFDGKRRSDMCLDLSSHLSSCPKASHYKLSFRDCTFGDLDVHYECLGSWVGLDDITYLALLDPEVQDGKQPRYRCGMYHKGASGRVSFSLSMDSSCRNQLTSPWQGFESFSLTPFRLPDPPLGVLRTTCTFPKWAQGEWQNIKISGNEFEYRDEITDQLHTAFCLAQIDVIGERFTLYSVNQCGKETLSCIWLKRRSENVLEFILSPNENSLDATWSCSADRMWKRSWITQGRKFRTTTSCPVQGEFVGILPDDRSLCARLSSNCKHPNYMHHTMFPCENDSIPVEERFYECLGQWQEGGITYIYTWRRDVHRYECFAGVSVSENQVFLMEAGSSCLRGLQPLIDGMKIVKAGSCTSKAREKSFDTILADSTDVSNFVEGYKKGDRALWSSLVERQLRFSTASTSSISSIFKVSLLILLLRWLG